MNNLISLSLVPIRQLFLAIAYGSGLVRKLGFMAARSKVAALWATRLNISGLL